MAGCIAGQAGLTRQISPSSDSLSGEATTRPQALCIYWADTRALDQFARHSIHPVPSCADIKFSTTALPFLAGYLLLCRRKVYPPPPGFLADRVVTPGALYNHWDHRPVVIFLQQLFMGYAISVRLPVSTFTDSVRWSLRSAPPSPASCCYTSVSCSFRKRLLAHITRNHSY